MGWNRRGVATGAVVAVTTACSPSDGEGGNHLNELELDLIKGQPGAQPGQPRYCDDPAQLCELGEGDCDFNTQCVAPLVCGRKKGTQFGRQADACVPSHCVNKKRDGDETQIDCGGSCGTICAAVTCSSTNGPSRCSADCLCATGEGDCDYDSDCLAGLVCHHGAGSLFGFSGDACLAASCLNHKLDTGELGIDCGGPCPPCVPCTPSGLGFLPGDNFSQALDVSSDGSVVLGNSARLSQGGTEPFLWTQANGLQPLGVGVGSQETSGHALSADGSVAVGYDTCVIINGGCYPRAWRWTATTGYQTIAPDYGIAFDVSADGGLAVGAGSQGAFRWPALGQLEYLAPLPDTYTGSAAYAISGDGSTISGYITDNDRYHPYRWTQSTGFDVLPTPTGYPRAQVLGANVDASVLVGDAWDDNGAQLAVRWTPTSGAELIGYLSLNGYTTAYDVSDDGGIVVGRSAGIGYVWDEVHGMRSMESILSDAGLDLCGWRLTAVTAVSGDGRVMVGMGSNAQGQTEAWRAVLP
jgi:uncharacterized membrane protein